MVESSPSQPGGSRIISRVLPPAIRFWLSTQLDHVDDLSFQIKGRDREILSGHIPEVVLSAQKAVYQGIHLSQATATASAIRINLGQVVRRKPLRLLAAFPISGEVELTEADLNASLGSSLLGEGLYDFLRLLSRSQPEARVLRETLSKLPKRNLLSHYVPSVEIVADQILLQLQPKPAKNVPAIAISTELAVRDGHCLCLQNPHWRLDNSATTAPNQPLSDLNGFEIDLGSEVTLKTCRIADQKLQLSGTVNVLPEAV